MYNNPNKENGGRAMKNHVRVGGKLLQTNKTWGHLKQKQQEWILQTAHKQYDRFLRERGKLPVEGSKKQLIEEIYTLIEERKIWIPYGEVYRVLCKHIARWNRREEAKALQQKVSIGTDFTETSEE